MQLLIIIGNLKFKITASANDSSLKRKELKNNFIKMQSGESEIKNLLLPQSPAANQRAMRN